MILIKKLLVMFGVMSIISSFFIAIMTYVNIGFSADFFSRWSRSVLFAVVVMMPLGGTIMFIANKIVNTVFLNSNEFKKNILIGLLMGLSMEAIMAVSTTINILGFTDIESFISIWIKSYITALPFALIFSPIMTILIKPRIEIYLAKTTNA